MLEALIEPREVGDPVSPLRWTTASLRDLARELSDAGHPVSAPVVGGLLREMGFSLQGMTKTRAGFAVPDRDAQFRHINAAAESFLARGLPVVSVDAKQKEPIGEFARPGRTYRPKGDPKALVGMPSPAQTLSTSGQAHADFASLEGGEVPGPRLTLRG